MDSEYEEIKYSNKIDKNNVEIAVGLGEVDNLKPSKYFYETLNKAKTYDELEKNIKSYYENKELNSKESREKECDLVSINIAKYLEKSGFSLSPINLKTIHKNIFKDAFPQGLEKYVGVFRNVNISKDEEVLGGNKSVEYGDFDEINELLDYDFSQEKKKNYFQMNSQEQVLSVAKFISGIWQIHPFREGNTRTIAVFTIKYLKSKGFEAHNDIFKANSKYFRDALVLANYTNLKENISSDFSYLESFFNKFILNKDTDLKPLPNSKEQTRTNDTEKSVLSKMGKHYQALVNDNKINTKEKSIENEKEY